MEIIRRFVLIAAGIGLLVTGVNYLLEYAEKDKRDVLFSLDGPLTREKVWNGVKVCLKQYYGLDDTWAYSNKVRKRLEKVLSTLNRDMLLRDIVLASKEPSDRFFDIEGNIQALWYRCYIYFKLVFSLVNPEVLTTIGQMADFIYDALRVEQKAIINFGYPDTYRKFDVSILDDYWQVCKERCERRCEKTSQDKTTSSNTKTNNEVKNFTPPRGVNNGK